MIDWYFPVFAVFVLELESEKIKSELRSRLKGKETIIDSFWFVLLTSLLISSFMVFQKQIFIVLYEHECVLF